jgi:hypothetical protein
MQTILHNKVCLLAMAIAHQEGYFSPLVNIPQSSNNPGDIEIGDIGEGTRYGKTIFKNPVSGWLCLFEQIEKMVNGKSQYYKPTMTFAQMGLIYSGGNNQYARNICAFLGIDTTKTLGEYLTV